MSDPVIGSHTTVGQGGIVQGCVGVRCTIHGVVRRTATVGDHSTVWHGATVDGHVGNNTTIGPSSTVRVDADVGDNVQVGASAVIEAKVVVASGLTIPAGAKVTPAMAAERRGDVVTVGMVGSESRGRYVTIARLRDGRAWLIVGCWRNHQGGTPDLLEAHLGDDPWDRAWHGAGGVWGAADVDDVEASLALRALYHAQYVGIIALARSLERAWAVPVGAATH